MYLYGLRSSCCVEFLDFLEQWMLLEYTVHLLIKPSFLQQKYSQDSLKLILHNNKGTSLRLMMS